MQRVIIGFIISVTLAACGGQERSPLPPPNDEMLAAQKFNNSKGVKSLKARGVEISCYDACTKVTDSFLQLLADNVEGLTKLSKKVEKFEVRSDSNHYFTSPAGSYYMFLPVDLDQKTLDLAFQIFDKLFVLESKVSFKSFPKSLDPKNIDALNVLIENSTRFNSYNIKSLQLVSGGTLLSSMRSSAEINIDSVISSVDIVFSRLNLFADFYSRIPNLDIGVLGTDDEIYQILSDLLQRWREISDAITRKKLTRLVFMNEKQEHYFSMSLLGVHSISFETSQSVDDILAVINYEMYLLDLGLSLSTEVVHKDWYASLKMYPVCSNRIPELETILSAKAEKIDVIYVDHGINAQGFPVPLTPTRFKNGNLYLNCYEDTVETMKRVIEGI